MEQMFTTVEAAKLVGASYRQINHWVKNRPAGYQPPGPGNHVMLGLDDVVELGVVHRLRQLGVDLDHALRVAGGSAGHDELRLDWGEMLLVVRVDKIRAKIVGAAPALERVAYERERLTQEALPFPDLTVSTVSHR